ncbi:MAG: hypothetical protein IRZ31_19090 [Thermogemmatispora sp.]|uniref:hypothetical protein n=1 Tax=Thermogemmatispora sp. TaxID=1968838 RepID=UPI00260BC5D1|nr:hypothetical protein [Thermogemmatispora sp.]MBX5459004.1 hypothetical protein [Thermogemmatispora sp.]
MGFSWMPIVLAIILITITLFVTLRVAVAYPQVRSTRLLMLGISMGMIALTGLADLLSMLVTSVTLHTDWFLYLGQACAYLFILLSLLNNSDQYLNALLRLQIIFSLVAFCVGLLSPILPDLPNVGLRATLSGSRSLLCLGIFYLYTTALLKKPTRFAFLMGTAFLFLGLGYLMIFQKYFFVDSLLVDNIGDGLRIIGLLAMLAAVLGS